MEILITIGVIAWVVYSMWEKHQEQKAEAEFQRRREAEKRQGPLAPAGGGQPAPDRRYHDIQEEIRRKIAERQAQQGGQAPAPPPTVMPPARPPRPVALPPLPSPFPAERERPRVPPPIVVMAPPPAPPVFTSAGADDAEELDEGEELIKAERDLAAMRARAAAVTARSTAPILGDEGVAAGAGGASLSLLRAALARPGAARQAFLLREVFDRPISERPGGCGGLDGWR